MSRAHEECSKESSGDDGQLKPSALNSAQSYVAGSPGTSCPGCVGCQAFSLAFGALIEWATGGSLIFPETHFAVFGQAPYTSGNEHDVWFHEQSNRWFKATYPNQFGLAWGRAESATPLEYLSRLVLQNKFFGDDIHLVGIIECSQKLRVLISQPHIAGGPAPAPEIQKWFKDLGFVQLESKNSIAWYRKRENLLVADAHEGNVIKTLTGVLVPIDLNIVQPMGEMRKWVESNCDCS